MCLVGGNEEGVGESVSMGCDGRMRAVEGGDGMVGWVVVRGFGTFAISCATYSSVSVVPIGRFST